MATLRREAGVTSVVTAGTSISFDTPYPVGSTYIIFANCYDGFGDVGYNITVQNENGFTVVPLVNATFEWETVQVGTEAPGTGRLSRDWKAGDFWMEAVRDMGIEVPPLFNFERFNLIQRAIEATAGQLYGLIGNDYLTETSVTITDNKFSLASLRIMRTGQQMRLSVTSVIGTDTVWFHPVSEIEFRRFRPDSQNNKGVFRFMVSGETVTCQKHTASSSYGTVTLTYPRVPIKALADTQYLDLPDGLPIAIALCALKNRLQERYQVPNKKDYAKDMVGFISDIYGQYGVTLKLTEAQEKAKVIL